MWRIVRILTIIKVVPVNNMNFSQYSPFSWATLMALVSWCVVPLTFFWTSEWWVNEEIAKSPSTARGIFEYFTFYLNCISMGLTLLIGPHILALLLKKCTGLIDLEKMPLPRRQWMIWLSGPILLLGVAIDNFGWSVVLQNNPEISWEVAAILCCVPNTLLAAMFCLVQTSMILISCSVLTYFVEMFEDLKYSYPNIEEIWTVCETYEEVANIISIFYMLLFATSSTTIMVLSFLMYYNWGLIVSFICCSAGILSGSLVLLCVTLQADDCHGAINALILHIRCKSYKTDCHA